MVLSLILDQFLKNRGGTRTTIVRLGFFTFQGILAGILMNDILRLLYGDFEGKANYQYGIAAAVAISPYVLPELTLMKEKSNNVTMGIGMGIGTYMANRTEHGEPIVGDKNVS